MNDPGNSPDETPIPSGLWAIFSGYYQAAVNQFTNTIRDVSLTQFGLLMAAFCVLLLGFFKYVAPLIPKDALNVVREASKDGLEIAKAELDRRHEEAKKTETPLDDAVIESLKLLHGAMTAVVNITTSLAQAVAQQQVQAQPVAAGVTSSPDVTPKYHRLSDGTEYPEYLRGLPEMEIRRRTLALNISRLGHSLRNSKKLVSGFPDELVIRLVKLNNNDLMDVVEFEFEKAEDAEENPADVARQEAEAAVAQANEALEMTEVDDLDYGDARG